MIAVTGATGQLGSAFLRLLPDAAGLTRADLDLTRPDLLRERLDRLHCDTLINCAAYTAVDQAETDEPTAEAVNARSVEVMARWAADRSARLVTYSTDYVFDGTKSGAYVESDLPNPQSAYGRTKLLGEQVATQANPDCLVVRTSWVISGTHPSFVSTILRLVRERPISVVDDQHGSPTLADDLASHTLRLLDIAATGLVHATNEGATTWFHLAQAAAELAGIEPDRISPCTTAEFPRPAPRPANSLLVSERYPDVGPMPPWRESLPSAVEQILTWL
ncbi:MAG: dTDP-4-dehydrorhamnose reductase [Acidimicrobiia bacterium]|nr:dTDP-4-dehydrorhamnose reductase [Acidimicrobiia bacterium]